MHLSVWEQARASLTCTEAAGSAPQRVELLGDYARSHCCQLQAEQLRQKNVADDPPAARRGSRSAQL